MNVLFIILVLVVVLGPLIFVHEAGHFLAAKWAGIYVHRFSLGLGSPIPWLTWKRGETEYSISWLPLGGYVKMATAEEGADSSALEGGAVEGTQIPADRMFEAKPVWKRMIVILAGVTMNTLFAWILYSFLAAKNGEQINPVTTVGQVTMDSLPESAQALRDVRPGDRIAAINGQAVSSWNDITDQIGSASGDSLILAMADGRQVVLPIHHAALEERVAVLLALEPYRLPVIGLLQPGHPAARAGLQPGDTIVRVNGDTIRQWYDLVGRIRSSAGQEMVLGIVRNGGVQQVKVTPEPESEKLAGGGTREIGKIGIGPDTPITSRKYSIGEAIVAGGQATLTASTQIFRTVQGLLSGRISQRNLGGPILIGQMAAQTARLGIDAFLAFMGLISINLAVLNLLPIPVLDGGQFMFLLAEGVRRRPLSLKLRERLTGVGLVLVVLLMVLAFSNDIRRILGL